MCTAPRRQTLPPAPRTPQGSYPACSIAVPCTLQEHPMLRDPISLGLAGRVAEKAGIKLRRPRSSTGVRPNVVGGLARSSARPRPLAAPRLRKTTPTRCPRAGCAKLLDRIGTGHAHGKTHDGNAFGHGGQLADSSFMMRGRPAGGSAGPPAAGGRGRGPRRPWPPRPPQ